MVHLDKALGTAALGVVKGYEGIKAVGKMGVHACKWMYEKTGIKGAVKKASNEYADFKTEHQEDIDRMDKGVGSLKEKVRGKAEKFDDKHGLSDKYEGAKKKVSNFFRNANEYEEINKATTFMGDAWDGMKNLPGKFTDNIKERAANEAAMRNAQNDEENKTE